MTSFTPDLFDQPIQEARERLKHAMDTLNNTFVNGSVFLGGAFGVTDICSHADIVHLHPQT